MSDVANPALTDEELAQWDEVLSVSDVEPGAKAEYLKFHRRVRATITALKAEVSDRDARVAVLVEALEKAEWAFSRIRDRFHYHREHTLADMADDDRLACKKARETQATAARELLERVEDDRKCALERAVIIEQVEARAEAAEAEVERLKARQRTEGTLEVCERWRSNHCADYPQSDHDYTLCQTANCPLRTAEREG